MVVFDLLSIVVEALGPGRFDALLLVDMGREGGREGEGMTSNLLGFLRGAENFFFVTNDHDEDFFLRGPRPRRRKLSDQLSDPV